MIRNGAGVQGFSRCGSPGEIVGTSMIGKLHPLLIT